MSGRGKGGQGHGIAKPAMSKLGRRRPVKRISGIVYDANSRVITVYLEDATKNTVRERARRKSMDVVIFPWTANLPGREIGNPYVIHIRRSQAGPIFRMLKLWGALRGIHIRSTTLPCEGAGAWYLKITRVLHSAHSAHYRHKVRLCVWESCMWLVVEVWWIIEARSCEPVNDVNCMSAANKRVHLHSLPGQCSSILTVCSDLHSLPG